MSAASAAQLLERLQSGLSALLSNLGGATAPESGALDSAWSEIERRFAALRAGLESGELPDGERERLAEGARHCLRLQAVAQTLLAQHREDVLRERDVCVGARARLRRIRSGWNGASGASCDVSG